MAESELVKPAEQRITKPVEALARQNPKRWYQNAFNDLKIQRNFPTKLMSSQDAVSMLVENYNFSVLNRNGKDYYCLPNVELTDSEDFLLGRDYFDSVQDMRENLCAFGLPPAAKGSKLSRAIVHDMESWARCAHFTTDTVPKCERDMMPRDAREILKSLDYIFCDNIKSVLLPGVKAHSSNIGINRFDTIIDLFNYTARFGLDTSTTGSEDSVSMAEAHNRKKLEVFVASVATFDVR